MIEVATEAGHEPAQVALAWMLAKPGGHRADHRRDQDEAPRLAIDAVEVSLSPEQVARLEAPDEPHAVRGL